MSLKGKIESLELTDPGKVRERNEDYVGSDLDAGLLVLADGMGGYNAGEIASQLAVQTIVDMVVNGVKRENRIGVDESTGLMRQSIILRDAIARANKVIYQTAQSKSQCEGMGTTVVACLFYDNRVTIAHVGDSRMYRLRDEKFEQVTQDHSLLQELISRGFYSREEAQKSLNRNYVTRALGVEPQVEVEVQEEVVRQSDVFVLCSDGLSDMVEDEDIQLTINTFHGNLELAGQQLIQLTNDNGGRDNVSITLARVVKSFAAQRSVFGKLANLFS